jgi:hypothetical protein
MHLQRRLGKMVIPAYCTLLRIECQIWKAYMFVMDISRVVVVVVVVVVVKVVVVVVVAAVAAAYRAT